MPCLSALAHLQQVLRGERVESVGQEAGKAVDVYACGVHLYKMLFQRYPFDGEDAEAMSRNIMNGAIRQPREVMHGDPVWDLLTRMLDSNWQSRISIDNIMEHAAYLENLPSEVAVRFPRHGWTTCAMCAPLSRWLLAIRCCSEGTLLVVHPSWQLVPTQRNRRGRRAAKET